MKNLKDCMTYAERKEFLKQVKEISLKRSEELKNKENKKRTEIITLKFHEKLLEILG